MPDFNEFPVVFECGKESLFGIVHKANSEVKTATKMGVLIVVGGPQTRVGSHRQFLLLARYLAENGINVMRFDYRGMGDSSGDIRTFEGVNSDIGAAVDQFCRVCPEVENICLWGLCDAVSAALFYAHKDKRVDRLILLNPWVRTEAGEAKAYLKHYYLSRLMSAVFWKKLLLGRVNFGGSLKSASNMSKLARSGGEPSGGSLPEKMLEGLRRFKGDTLIILSGDDLTAAEFSDLISSNKDWRRALECTQVEIKHIPDANHTFSCLTWRHMVESWTLSWLMK